MSSRLLLTFTSRRINAIRWASQVRQSALALVFALLAATAGWAQPTAQDRSLAGLQAAIADLPPEQAYGKFCDLFVIISPHPDKTIEGFIKRARAGEPGAFAFVSFMVWKGYAGFRNDQIAGKFGLIRAMNDGSGAAAGFIGQTFQQRPGTADNEKLDSYISALHWYGVAVGMGETKVHETATALIDSLSAGRQETRDSLMTFYNRGMEKGAAKRNP